MSFEKIVMKSKIRSLEKEIRSKKREIEKISAEKERLISMLDVQKDLNKQETIDELVKVSNYINNVIKTLKERK